MEALAMLPAREYDDVATAVRVAAVEELAAAALLLVTSLREAEV